jgi:hypothetical protein
VRALRRAVADETDLHPYLVEHDLRGLAASQLAGVCQALGRAAGREIRRGSQIRYVQRIDVRDEQRCLYSFEATGRDVVRAVNDLAQSSRRL